MPKKLLSMLSAERKLVDLRRDRLDAPDVRGFVLGLSDRLVLVSVVSDEVLYSGYAVLRLEDVTHMRWGSAQLEGWTAALRGLETPPAPEIDLERWESVLRGISTKHDLVTLHREAVHRDRVYIGRDVLIKRGLLIAECITLEGSADGHFAVALGELTRVDFGGNYERGLQRILEAGPEIKPRRRAASRPA